jgi:hypothetical protein
VGKVQTPSKQFSEILAQEARSPGTVRIPPARGFAPIGWMAIVGYLALGILVGVAGYAVVQDVVASDQERLLDDLGAAWTSGDEAALREVYAENAVLVSPEGVRYEGIDAIVDLGRTMAVSGFAAERTSGVVVGGPATDSRRRHSTFRRERRRSQPSACSRSSTGRSWLTTTSATESGRPR